MRTFPAAQTILLIIAALVAILTWVIPSGQYDVLSYDKSESVFIVKSAEGTTQLPATQETLSSLNVQIPLESFTSEAIYKPISIPNTYKAVDAQPQGIWEFLQAPVRGIIETADIIFLVLIIGGIVRSEEHTSELQSREN